MALANLSTSYGALGDYQKAKDLLERSLTILEKHYGEDHFQVAKILISMSVIYYVVGDNQRAKELLERALPILERHYGEEHFHVAIALANLSVSYGILGDAQRTKDLLEKALPILENHYGKDHFEVAIALANLSNSYETLGDYEEAKELLERALPVLEKHYGAEHFEVGIMLENLGMSCLVLGDYEEAKELLEKALPVLEKHYGAEHFEVAKTLVNLGINYGMLDDYQKQKGLLERALPILEKHYGKDHFEVAIALENLAIADEALGNSQRAKELIESATAIYQKHRVSVEECLSKREVEGRCLFTWEDIDEFNIEKDEERDFGKIKIDGEKFINYIKDVPEEKRSQLIELADKVEVTSGSCNLINKLISNQKVMNHLKRVKEISTIAIYGMMAKNVLADFLNEDYQGVAINVGFIAGGQGFAKVAKVASSKGLTLDSKVLGRSLRVASPFLARGASLISSLVNLPLPTSSIICGEVALSGEIRNVSHADLRLREAQKLGFKKAIMPKNGNYSSHDIEIIKLGHIKELKEIFNHN